MRDRHPFVIGWPVLLGALFLVLASGACTRWKTLEDLASDRSPLPISPLPTPLPISPLPTPQPVTTSNPSQLLFMPSVLQEGQEAPSPTPTVLVSEEEPTPFPTIAAPREGYGLNVKGVNYTDDSLGKAIALGFEWIKIYDHPPAERLPFKVLFRVNLPRPDEDWESWGHYRFLDAQLYADRIDAYEIGNEPNLIEEWGRTPDPAAYAELLKVAYREIKAADPDALVVAAGLAPVGSGGDPNHPDDLAFLRAMYEHGAADYFDVLAIHPFGFAYPPEMPPDGEVCTYDGEGFGYATYVRVEGAFLDRGCWPVDGLCFRRAELARQIMVEYGDADKPVWATEFGWVIRPPPCCLQQSDWPARYWQVVSEGKQARYILRAYDYAAEHWPWMEVMFLWNLDYSRYQRGDELTCQFCDSMGWFSILDPDGSPRLAYKWLMGWDVLH